jgi:dephospho-CoA kinase
MKTKLVIVGLDRAGKTTVGRLLWLLSLGRIKFADTSKRAWETESISKSVRVRAKKLQKDRLESSLTGSLARNELANLYDEWAMPIFRYVLKISDMYIGLRDVKVLERMRREYKLKVILVSANFKLARGQNPNYKIEELEAIEAEEYKYRAQFPDYRINNNGGWFSLLVQVYGIVKDLERSGEIKPINWTNLFIYVATSIIIFSYMVFGWRYLH